MTDSQMPRVTSKRWTARRWRNGAIGAVAALVTLAALTAGLGPAAAQSAERTFDPAFKMSKQYVAVTAYKVLRDHAPTLIADCEKNVKNEPDNRFSDLGGEKTQPFTRGAINCLDKQGYLAGNLPGVSAADDDDRTFDPAFPMSKQYVAVTVYKVLRDHAPALISGCEKNVKNEPDNRFSDLGGEKTQPFTRGAINCLDKMGYLAGNLPGVAVGGPSSSVPETFEPSDFLPATQEPTSS